MIPVFDSNILIDITRGYLQAHEEFQKYDKARISSITWIEVVAGAKSHEEEKKLEMFLAAFEIVHLDMAIARKAAFIRRTQRLKVPDAIILATAQLRNTLLVTRNSKDFSRSNPAIRIPYTL